MDESSIGFHHQSYFIHNLKYISFTYYTDPRLFYKTLRYNAMATTTIIVTEQKRMPENVLWLLCANPCRFLRKHRNVCVCVCEC